MLLGKRQPGPPMKRTTSMSEFTLDLNHATIIVNNPPKRNHYASASSHFLRACHLCMRPLISGHDIFMYRGDHAFCSSECRQQQINQDDNKHTLPMPSSTSPKASETLVAVAAAAVL